MSFNIMNIFPLKSMVMFFLMEKYDFLWYRYRSGLNEDAVEKVSDPFKYMLEINSLYPGDSASQYSIFCARFQPIVFSPFFLLSRQSLKYKISKSTATNR